MTTRILVVDDDEEIRTLLRRGLALEGFSVTTADDGEGALAIALNAWPDLVILDVMMPSIDGFDVCRRLRAADADLPILMLSARDEVPDRIAGLEGGADDYIVKPFALEELIARVRVQLRRKAPSVNQELRFADLRLDTSLREGWRGVRRMTFTATEHELLRLFLQHPNQVLDRAIIFERVWGYDFVGESKVIEVYVRYLREKLEAGGESRLIHTIRGVGYALRDLDGGMDRTSGVDQGQASAHSDGDHGDGAGRLRRDRVRRDGEGA